MSRRRSLSANLCAALAVFPLASRAQAPDGARLLPVARLQAALDREGFGVGLIDGHEGARTRGALLDYCRAQGLSEAIGRSRLLQSGEPLLMEYRITGQDLGQVGLAPSDWLEASLQPAMNYTSLDEALSEKFRMAKTLLANLNPGIRDWSTVRTDQPVTVRSPGPVRRREPAARLEIDCTAYRLRVYDAGDRLIASFPCSVARSATQIPVGDFTLGVFAPNPNYTWDPANFPESARAQEIGRRLILPPGPNNPVGRYWLSLSRPGFGIHGTPHPETIGRAESHGCFRMTNWDIETLASLARPGLPVHVRSASIPAPSRPPGADAP